MVSGVWSGNEVLQTNSLLQEKCQLNLSVFRNLDSSFNHSSPNVAVKGQLSAADFRFVLDN